MHPKKKSLVWVNFSPQVGSFGLSKYSHEVSVIVSISFLVVFRGQKIQKSYYHMYDWGQWPKFKMPESRKWSEYDRKWLLHNWTQLKPNLLKRSQDQNSQWKGARETNLGHWPQTYKIEGDSQISKRNYLKGLLHNWAQLESNWSRGFLSRNSQ